ncbi:hypothetical protein TRIUR3_27361 [Triticum urartu]|uniref:CASP-like protein n=1 Tax=Triticum urartu TaxID=4572 RepID=M7YH53_TRIUA|nr:hypothetical protein TRIUR3_27361 [Triticum urartu]
MASSKSIVLPAVVLALRLLAVALLAGSLSLVVTETDINSDFTVWRIPINLRFMDVYTYR